MRRPFKRPLAALLLAAGAALAPAPPAAAAQISVAVAANFIEPARRIAAAFRAKTGHEAVLSFGSSAQLFIQITQGAPFQVFLSADEERPAAAVAERVAVADSRFTYAVGKLVLWSRDPNLVKGPETLARAAFARIAIANPAVAPYGTAALDVMRALGVHETLRPRIVQGNSIAQAYQFVESGNAEVGFVALSQLAGGPEGSRWEPPQALYRPIRQDAVLLEAARSDDAARAFMAFLRGEEARAVIQAFGYEVVAP